jgi:hypothetical protein
MVIFHSYVKLPEGNFRVVDNLESQTSHPTVIRSFAARLHDPPMLETTVWPGHDQCNDPRYLDGSSGGGWLENGVPPNPIGKDMIIISQYFPLESCWGIPNS